MGVFIIIKLDYTIESPEERKLLVQKILEENPNPGEKYLEILADYLVLCMEKQEKKERKLLNDNRLTTINKRETSFEGLISQLENGEDGIYNLMNDSKYTIFQPKIEITPQDLEEIPALRQLRDSIQSLEERLKIAEGKEAFTIKKALIEMRREQYIIKNSYKKPVSLTKNVHIKMAPSLEDSFSLNKEGYVIPQGISLCDPKVCSAILCTYSKLRSGSYGRFTEDLWYLLEDFDRIKKEALSKYPVYQEICECKMQNLQNVEIQKILQDKYNITHSLEYISSLWRKKIPNLIASAAEDETLSNYYLNQEKGSYKKCSRCGKIKLAHNKYFSKNKTSKDGYYSICKDCRNTKAKKD